MGTRYILLVRHGQYGADDRGILTDLGREQAAETAKWMVAQNERIDTMWSSTLPRAKETADIIAASFPKQKVRRAGVLREGMYSKIKGYDIPPEERAEDRLRADSAYERFFKLSPRKDHHEVIVCHGNLIRYLVCRAMHIPVMRWTRMNSNHCGLTRILIRDTGAVRVVTYNETAHLPPKLIT